MHPERNAAGIIERSFNDNTYSDLTVKCQNSSWKVHRLIVCSQSTVLHAACMGEFKEAHTGIIDLDDDDPVPVEIMLKFFYTGKYNETSDEGKDFRAQSQVPVLTYILADKYDAPTLMKLAEKKFESKLGGVFTSSEYLSVVLDVYTIPTPTNALRAITVEYARNHLRDMMHAPGLESPLRATLRAAPEFTFDVLQRFVCVPLRGHCHSCGLNQNAEVLQARCVKCGKGGIMVDRT